MPQFHLNTPPRRAHPFYDLSDFAKGYVEAMFFTNGDTGDEREDLLNDLGVERLTRVAVANIARDCDQFQRDQRNVLAAAYAESDYSPEEAGRDLWLTRQGHGAGFWDREQLPHDIRTYLTAGAAYMGEVAPSVNRGWIYHP